MKQFVLAVLYIAASISLFALFQLTVVFSHEVNFKNTFISLIPIAIAFLLYFIYMKESKIPLEEDDYKEDEYEEGDVVNIFSGMPCSHKNGKYSEGVFFWYEKDKLYTTLDFHTHQGGDPDVFNHWLEQEQENSQYLIPTLQ